MHTVTFAQLGDLHYPDAENYTIEADIADVKLASRYTEKLAPAPLMAVMQHLQQHTPPVAGYLICGDLTTRGDQSAYDKSVEYLVSTLNLTAADADRVHVVPGNHDVARNSCVRDQEGKFDALHKAWVNSGVDVLARDFRVSSVTNAKSRTTLISMNSCVGCGEVRWHADRAKELLASGASESSELAEYDEQLDAPAFDRQAVASLDKTLVATQDGNATLIVSHHPLLPQLRPRIAPYAELANGGLVRSRLGAMRWPIVYCHGHTHSDSIEIVRQPESAPLVIVGAPQFRDGYNLLEIGFDSDERLLGLTIKMVRRANCTISTAVKRIALRQSRNPLEKRLRQVVSRTSDTPMRFNELLKSINSNVGSGDERRLQTKTLMTVLLEAEWLGLVTINNREEDSRFWMIERVGP